MADIEVRVDEETPVGVEIVEARIKPEQTKGVTPAYEAQTVLPDDGMTLGRVDVAAIPEPTAVLEIYENGDHDVRRIGTARVAVPIPPGYVIPSGTLEITENADGIDVYDKEAVNVRVPVPVLPAEYAIGGSIANKTAVGYHVADGTTEILGNTINYQSALEWIELPDSVKTIKAQAFANNNKMVLTDLPASLNAIEDYAFFWCTSMTSVRFHSTPSSIASNAFLSTKITDIYVPWAEGAVAGAPWGATNATVHYGAVD